MNDRVLKENDVLFVCNREGMAGYAQTGEKHLGLFSRDTRFLSRLVWWMQPDVLVLLDAITANGYESFYRYTNTPPSQQSRIPRESLFVKRHQWVNESGLYERVTIENYSTETLQFTVGYEVDADFVDMFEVRGFQDTPFSRDVSVQTSENCCTYVYRAKDGRLTATQISVQLEKVVDSNCQTGDGDESANDGWQPLSEQSTARHCSFALKLQPREQAVVSLRVNLQVVENGSPEDLVASIAFSHRAENVLDNVHAIRQSYTAWFAQMPRVSGDPRFVAWYEQGLKDVRMLQSDLGYGQLLTAGVPWYAVLFGRDSLIAARMMLLANPQLARGTLQTMAHFQGQAERPERDEQPGKIVHEVRDGELSRIGLLPFAPYYGSVDATPLFLMLAADYFRWTGDLPFLEQLLPHVEKAFHWIETYGDRDGDGFLEYWREAEGGIANQGWKDSGDSIMYEDGRLVEGPVALCEVQAYLHRAYADWANIYTRLSQMDKAQLLLQKANRLRERFQQQFLLPDGSIALALDGKKRPCKVVSSNMGQVLQSDLLTKAAADRVAGRMVADDMLTGFGIRTLSSREQRYNPLSYHNGSVWPHDTSLILYGLRRYGCKDEALLVVENLLRAQDAFPFHRLPELFAGFSVQESPQPVPYPVSCSPQAWAATTPIFVLEQLIGLRPDAEQQQILVDPFLPASITQLCIEGIRVGAGQLSLALTRENGSTEYAVLHNSTGWKVVTEPMARNVMVR